MCTLTLGKKPDAFEHMSKSCAQRLYSQASAAAILPACKRAALNALEYSVQGENVQSARDNKKRRCDASNQKMNLASG